MFKSRSVPSLKRVKAQSDVFSYIALFGVIQLFLQMFYFTTLHSFIDYNAHLDHSDYRWSSRGSDSSSHSSFLERYSIYIQTLSF